MSGESEPAKSTPDYTQGYSAEYVATAEGLSRVMSVDGELVPWDGIERPVYPKCTECGFPRGGGHADDCVHARPWQKPSRP